MMATKDKTLNWKFDHPDYPKVYTSSLKLLDDDVYQTKCELNVPKYVGIKIIPADATPSTPAPAPASSSPDSNPPKPKVVSRNTRSRKAKPKANELQPMPVILDNTNIIDLVPATLRHHFTDRLPNAVSPSVDSGANE